MDKHWLTLLVTRSALSKSNSGDDFATYRFVAVPRGLVALIVYTKKSWVWSLVLPLAALLFLGCRPLRCTIKTSSQTST